MRRETAEKCEFALSAAGKARGNDSCFIWAFGLLELDARVQPFVDDINEQIDEYIGDRDDENAALNDRIIAGVNAFD